MVSCQTLPHARISSPERPSPEARLGDILWSGLEERLHIRHMHQLNRNQFVEKLDPLLGCVIRQHVSFCPRHHQQKSASYLGEWCNGKAKTTTKQRKHSNSFQLENSFSKSVVIITAFNEYRGKEMRKYINKETWARRIVPLSNWGSWDSMTATFIGLPTVTWGGANQRELTIGQTQNLRYTAK